MTYCCDSEEEGRRHRIAFNSLYLFSFRSIIYEANGEELYNFTLGATVSCLSIVRELPQFLPVLKLKAEFQEEEHASTTPTESIICPCLTMSPVSHSHSASDQKPTAEPRKTKSL